MSKVFFGAMLIALVWSVPSLAQGTALDTATAACLTQVRALNRHVADINIVRPGERIAVAPGRFYRVALSPTWRRTVSGICRMNARIALASNKPLAAPAPVSVAKSPSSAIVPPHAAVSAPASAPVRAPPHIVRHTPRARPVDGSPVDAWFIASMLFILAFIAGYAAYLGKQLTYWRRAYARVSTPRIVRSVS